MISLVKHFSLSSPVCVLKTFEIPFYINPSMILMLLMLMCCCFASFFERQAMYNSFSKCGFFCRKRQMMFRLALHFARIEWCCQCMSAVWCTIFTAIYGFEGFVNIILMFNETIINHIVCKSKIATMTFFRCCSLPCHALLMFCLFSGDECSDWHKHKNFRHCNCEEEVFLPFLCFVVIAI